MRKIITKKEKKKKTKKQKNKKTKKTKRKLFSFCFFIVFCKKIDYLI